MTDRLIYANTRAITKETTLFSKERIARMIESEELSLAIKVLYEVGYGGGIAIDSPDLFEILLAEEERRVNAFMEEVKITGFGLECFMLKNDYHNAKVLLKSKYTDSDGTFMLLPEAVYPLDELKAILLEGKTDSNIYLDEVARKIERLDAEGNLIPRIIDTLLDKALFYDIASRLAKVKDKAVKEYFTTLSDCTNLLSMLRVKKIGERAAFLADCFVSGGSITLDKLVLLLESDEAEIKKSIEKAGYGRLATYINMDNFSELEAAIDNYLIAIIKKDATDVYSTAPLLNYYLQKLNEIKMIRIVLVCLKNKVDLSEINKRMRTIYA